MIQQENSVRFILHILNDNWVYLTMSILPPFIRIRALRRKANMSLCFSNRLRQTLEYRLKVKNSLMLTIRSFTVSVERWKSSDWNETLERASQGFAYTFSQTKLYLTKHLMCVLSFWKMSFCIPFFITQWKDNGIVPACFELAIPAMKIPKNHSREYWYMGSTIDRSDTQKKRIWARTATGTYSRRVASMSLSVASATVTLA